MPQIDVVFRSIAIASSISSVAVTGPVLLKLRSQGLAIVGAGDGIMLSTQAVVFTAGAGAASITRGGG